MAKKITVGKTGKESRGRKNNSTWITSRVKKSVPLRRKNTSSSKKKPYRIDENPYSEGEENYSDRNSGFPNKKTERGKFSTRDSRKNISRHTSVSTQHENADYDEGERPDGWLSFLDTSSSSFSSEKAPTDTLPRKKRPAERKGNSFTAPEKQKRTLKSPRIRAPRKSHEKTVSQKLHEESRNPSRVTSASPHAPQNRKDISSPMKSRKNSARKTSSLEGVRLQKYLAANGYGSRRDCEELIITGRITINDETVSELGTRVLSGQKVRVDGLLIKETKRVYYMLNKPGNFICTNDDPDGRRRAVDLIRERTQGLFPVGRLDLHSEGLLIITNDGDLANRLTHPSYEVPKVYRVRVSGHPSLQEIYKMRKGVYLSEGLVKAEDVKLYHRYKDGTAVLEMTLREGRNREVRRIFARLGHNVLQLVRVAVGPLKLGKLPLGEYRPLTAHELKQLRSLVGLE